VDTCVSVTDPYQNIGLNAKILSTKTFTMFVVMALVTTFATTPLTIALYPPEYQRKIEAWKRGEIDWDTGRQLDDSDKTVSALPAVEDEKLEGFKVRKMLVYLRFDNMPAILAFMSLLSGPRGTEIQVHPAARQEEVDADDKAGISTDAQGAKRRVMAHGVRLIGLTERTSTVMQVAEVDEYALQDPLVNTFRTFGQLYSIPTTGEVDVVPESGFADALINRAKDESSDLLFLPWSETGSLSEIDFSSNSVTSAVSDGDYAKFILSAIVTASCNTAVFVNHSVQKKKNRPGLFRNKSIQSIGSSTGVRDNFKPTALLGEGSRHIFCPLFGGPDDLLAVSLTLQMVEKGCTATIIRFVVNLDDHEEDEDYLDDIKKQRTTTRIESEAVTPRAEKQSSFKPNQPAVIPQGSELDASLFEAVKNNLSAEVLGRVVFEIAALSAANDPMQATIDRTTKEIGLLPKNAGDMVVVGRNWGLKGIASGDSDVERCLGVIGTGIVRSTVKGGVLVVKSI
jgi:hypothetical protein